MNLDLVERTNRKILLELAAVHGPIFKAVSLARLCICVVGLKPGRRLLKDSAAALRPVTIDITSLVPEGFMRQMEGEVHRRYRDLINRGVKALDIEGMSAELASIASARLAAFARASNEASPHEFAEALGDIASAMLVRVFFGARPDAPQGDRLLTHYRRLGPHGLVWRITPRQTESFNLLRDELRAQLKARSEEFESGLLGKLAASGQVDDTLLGNLIYMAEMGRYDLRGLLRWTSRYAAENEGWIDAIARGGEQGERVAEAFVAETLRMDQSERLLRNVKEDILFDGFLIPRGAMVRVCMWEAHKDDASFTDPFSFDPARFMTGGQIRERFSPFGLDHHQCPFSGVSLALAASFLRALSAYRVSLSGEGPAVRGAYHWEPNPKFTVRLKSRAETPQ